MASTFFLTSGPFRLFDDLCTNQLRFKCAMPSHLLLFRDLGVPFQASVALVTKKCITVQYWLRLLVW